MGYVQHFANRRNARLAIARDAGSFGKVEHEIGRIVAEWPGKGKPKVVATGGLAAMVAPLTKTVKEVAPDLTLHGLRIAAGVLKIG